MSSCDLLRGKTLHVLPTSVFILESQATARCWVGSPSPVPLPAMCFFLDVKGISRKKILKEDMKGSVNQRITLPLSFSFPFLFHPDFLNLIHKEKANSRQEKNTEFASLDLVSVPGSPTCCNLRKLLGVSSPHLTPICKM